MNNTHEPTLFWLDYAHRKSSRCFIIYLIRLGAKWTHPTTKDLIIHILLILKMGSMCLSINLFSL
ncbi:hypothetical protein GCM10007086_13510 [Photobacterium aphoticum]|nr:hypothetical protein GCM10007086_13510 [Photobacterium aphoticum]